MNDDDESFTQEELDAYLARLDALNSECGELLSQCEQLLGGWAVTHAGPHLPDMLSSFEKTSEFLSHPDPNLRKVAIHLAVTHWKRLDEVAEYVKSLAVGEADRGVRLSAIRAVGDCFAATQNSQAGSTLASIAQDSGLPDIVRISAYRALAQVDGPAVYHALLFGPKVTVDSFSQELITRYLSTP